MQQRRPISLAEYPKLSGETADEYERRIWPEVAHWTSNKPDAKMFIPAMSFKKSVATAAKRTPIKIPGQRNATYTKFFVSDVMVMADVVLSNTRRSEVEGAWVYVPGQPGSGGGSKVWKCFPQAQSWNAAVDFAISEDIITKEVFELYLKKAGASVGIGVWRPEVGGLNGRFMPTKFEWREDVQEDQFLKNLAKRV